MLQQQEVAVSNDQRQRAALAICEITGGFMLLVGIIVGFTGRKSIGGSDCGSVLGGGGGEAAAFAACDKALSAPTLWTVLLLVLGVVVLIAGWVIDTMQKNAHGQQRGIAQA